MKALIFILLGFVSLGGIGQVSEVDYLIFGNESSEYSTDLDTLSGFLYIVGNTNECGSNDGFVVKYKEDSIYKRVITGSESIEIIEAVETYLSDTIFIAGYTNENQDYNVYISKLDTVLNVIETKILELDNWNFCKDIAVGDGFLIGVGETHNGIDYDALLFKVNTNLDTLWTYSLSQTLDQKLTKVISYNDSIYIACGYSEVLGKEKDVLLVSINVNTGDTLWTNTYGGVREDYCNSLIRTQDGGIAGFGTTSSYTSTTKDTYLFKVDSSGSFLWSNLHQVQSASNTLDENGIDLIELDNGNLIVSAITESFGAYGVKSTMIMKTTSVGDWMGGYIYDGGHDDYPTAMMKVDDTTIFVGGIANSQTFGYSDSYLIKIKTINVNNTINILQKEQIKLCYSNVEEETKKERLVISPNPISSEFFIRSNSNEKIQIVIYSLLGKEVFHKNSVTNQSNQFPQNIAFGSYVMKVQKGTTVTFYKIIYAK